MPTPPSDRPGGDPQVLELFPRYLLQGQLPDPLLQELQALAAAVLADPASCPDAAPKLAGQLALQRELGPEHPAAAALCERVILPACERWIRHVIDRQPPQGRGPWTPGRYSLQMIDLWLNVQRAGDYNPAHTHGGSFSGVLYLQVPPQIRPDSFDGQLCLHGPEEWHIQSFRTGMAHYLLPRPGDYYVFPAWQPHSVAPFRGEGERWSIAFNVVALPKPPSPPGLPPPSAPSLNVSLSSTRPRPGGFG
ncbi:MAG: putative 2OG-Fe(II) oxygenase [Cyanobium sp.]